MIIKTWLTHSRHWFYSAVISVQLSRPNMIVFQKQLVGQLVEKD